jgi:hypothetical protein
MPPQKAKTLSILKKDTSASTLFKRNLKSTFDSIRRHTLRLKMQTESIEREEFNQGILFDISAFQRHEWDTLKEHSKAMTNSMLFFNRQFSASNQLGSVLCDMISSTEDRLTWLNFAFSIADSFGSNEESHEKETKLFLESSGKPLMDFEIFQELNDTSYTLETYVLPIEKMDSFNNFLKTKIEKTKNSKPSEDFLKKTKEEYKEYKENARKKAMENGFIRKWDIFSERNADFFSRTNLCPTHTWRYYNSTWKNLMGWKSVCKNGNEKQEMSE